MSTKRLKQLTPEQFAEEMSELLKIEDEERRHIQADALLVSTLHSLGYGEGCKVFDEIVKCYA